MPKINLREFEEESQMFISSALSICEGIAGNCNEPQQKTALCAAALSLQEAIKMFIILAKAV